MNELGKQIINTSIYEEYMLNNSIMKVAKLVIPIRSKYGKKRNELVYKTDYVTKQYGLISHSISFYLVNFICMN